MNLAWKLAGVIAGDLPKTVLDSYEQERKPHARHMIQLSLGVGWSMTAGGEIGNLIRRIVVPRMSIFPGMRDKIVDSRTPALRRSALVHRSRAPWQLTGTLCPNLLVADGRRVDGVLGDGFALITRTPPADAQYSLLEKRGAVVSVARPGSVLDDWLRRGHASAAIIRPDRTVMRASRDVQELYENMPTFVPAGMVTPPGR
jgi:3-(3-hydroxy-phenyl)propionate hydroxylase